eukprot:TRINITY_DN33209_c0_g1_i1.p1 TRINITY_DN33209_c0_g1~~TRINITY_DN33209_c0_g1_i1.p1  ORF type:complete len:251 (-),score=23.40 TRINITY_DN33209_c0_g1_i1:69-710(-)
MASREKRLPHASVERREYGRFVCTGCNKSFLVWQACYDHMSETGHVDLEGVSRSAGSAGGSERFLKGTRANGRKVVLLTLVGDCKVGERLRVVGQTKGSWVVKRDAVVPALLELRKSSASGVAQVAGRTTLFRWLDGAITDVEDDSCADEEQAWIPPVHPHLPSTDRGHQQPRGHRANNHSNTRAARNRSRSRSHCRGNMVVAREMPSYEDLF